MEKEIRLWRAVLDQALEDALLIPETRTEAANKKLARTYLSSPSDDLSEVCYLACIDTTVVERVCKRLLRRGRKTRLPQHENAPRKTRLPQSENKE